MDKHVIKDFELNGKRVEVYVSYSKGEYGRKRGYTVHVQPYTLDEHEGYSVRTTVGFSGVRCFLLEVSRKSTKKMNEAVAMVTNDILDQLLERCSFE